MVEKDRLTENFRRFVSAVDGFQGVLEITASDYSENVEDAINNGKIQKFEYCTELSWKLLKNFLLEIHGIDAKTPKLVVKEFFLLSAFDDEGYECFLDMIDERNRLSHIYSDNAFLEVLKKLPSYLSVMMIIRDYLEQNI